jgi:hypothetical protein
MGQHFETFRDGEQLGRLIGVQADNASIISAAAISIAVNIVSMQEMMAPAGRR